MTDKELCKQAKEYFAQIHKTDALIRRLVDTVSALRAGSGLRGSQLRPDKVRASGAGGSCEETIARIVDLEADINRRIDELIAMKQGAFSLICRVRGLDRQNILVARYIQLKEWETIAAELNFSERQLHRLHGEALLSFAKENLRALAP